VIRLEAPCFDSSSHHKREGCTEKKEGEARLGGNYGGQEKGAMKNTVSGRKRLVNAEFGKKTFRKKNTIA